MRALALGVSALALPLASSAEAELPSRKDLSLGIATAIAMAAIEACEASGYAVSAAVVGRSGEIIIHMRGDNSGPHTMESSFRKAYTSRTFRVPSLEMANRLKADPLLPQIHLSHVLAAPGGLPIKAGDETIGGVGVSGAPGGQNDENCARAGIAEVAGLIK